MGLSSNQARFLSLTSRQVDLEQRIQQICQRRLRLSSELENVATAYNNQIANRKMFLSMSQNKPTEELSTQNLDALNYKVIDNNNRIQISQRAVTPSGFKTINSQAEFLDFVTKINNGTLSASGNYILNCDLDLTGNPQTTALITKDFSGVFDGNGHTINGLTINSGSGNLGLFAQITGATVENLTLSNVNINATNSSLVAGLAANAASSTINNVFVSGNIKGGPDRIGGVVASAVGSTISNATCTANVSGQNSNISTGSDGRVGGIAGANFGGSTIENCYSSGTITSDGRGVGGIAGDSNSSTVAGCYSTSNVTGKLATGGLAGISCAGYISDSYSTGTVNGITDTGGLVGGAWNNGTITNSYATGNVNGSSASGGFVGGNPSDPPAITGCFYDNNLTGTNLGAVDASGTTPNTAGWNSDVWNKSTAFPTLPNAGYQTLISDLESGLRNGKYSLIKDADEFTQDKISINGNNYEEVDWRSTPEIFDELYGGDDVAAEDKYDKIVSEINSQDKKLQLEQTSIEVQYKAITSERESVKKILDTNAQASFKYFS